MGSRGGSSLLLSQQVCAEVCSGPDPGQREGQAWILGLQGAHGAGGQSGNCQLGISRLC